MTSATIRFHGELAGFLAPAARERGSVQAAVDRRRSVKDAIEAAGVPHTEVASIEADGVAIGFADHVEAGSVVDVFGFDRATDPAAQPAAAPLAVPYARPPRFVADGHLGRLARYLRLLGFDVRYQAGAADAELARASADEDRILLTRDRGLLKRSIVRFGYLVREDDPQAQLSSVVRRFGLRADARPFSRCVRCNGSIETVERETVAAELAAEPRTLRFFDDFGRCTVCGRIYWPGSHFERMRRLLAAVLAPGDTPSR